jgi:hypothetical protein
VVHATVIDAAYPHRVHLLPQSAQQTTRKCIYNVFMYVLENVCTHTLRTELAENQKAHLYVCVCIYTLTLIAGSADIKKPPSRLKDCMSLGFRVQGTQPRAWTEVTLQFSSLRQVTLPHSEWSQLYCCCPGGKQ